MRFTALIILAFLAAFTGTALAADVVAEADPSAADAAKAIFDAVMHGQWWAAAASAVVLLCAGARKFMPDSWKAGVKGDIIGVATAFVMAFAGAIGTWAVAPGAVMSFAVIMTALKISAGAIGGFTILHKVASWLMAAGWLPAWAVPILKLMTMVIGSNAVTKAEAAGDKAVETKPATGLTGDHTIVEIE